MGEISGAVLGTATISILGVHLALVLVDPEFTYPHQAQRMLKFVERALFAAPIILLSPRVCGFSRAYATFNIDLFLQRINVDEIAWADLPAHDHAHAAEVPF
ncbi:hypothetical protein SKZ59_07425 [Janthinobacterium sp. GMG2]|uniref:hypothetical protein n=1 Tax=Janthinobacterium sp. GMG2 TaxID=3096606 RepID=UPI0029F569B5|nr:hypothetical protein [Janthinobacterium sp. GMG2]MDX8121594.1 hypothetical protein [Janthinobacterium sp. GMG2]